jgi:hypothetical protein
MTGVAVRVSEIQTETGIKDKVTEYWIELLLKKANGIRNENPRVTSDELQKTLTEWLDGQPGDKMNPLLDIAGMIFAALLVVVHYHCSTFMSRPGSHARHPG